MNEIAFTMRLIHIERIEPPFFHFNVVVEVLNILYIKREAERLTVYQRIG